MSIPLRDCDLDQGLGFGFAAEQSAKQISGAPDMSGPRGKSD
jgi:hypothetical protein